MYNCRQFIKAGYLSSDARFVECGRNLTQFLSEPHGLDQRARGILGLANDVVIPLPETAVVAHRNLRRLVAGGSRMPINNVPHSSGIVQHHIARPCAKPAMRIHCVNPLCQRGALSLILW